MTSCRCLRWRISAILDFRGPIMGSLKIPCTTSSIETIALKCLVYKKIAFFCILATDRQTNRQTDEQMDSTDALSRSRYRERRLKTKKQSEQSAETRCGLLALFRVKRADVGLMMSPHAGRNRSWPCVEFQCGVIDNLTFRFRCLGSRLHADIMKRHSCTRLILGIMARCGIFDVVRWQ